MKLIKFSIPPKQLKEVDKWAEKTFKNRSEFVREALRAYVKFLERMNHD